MGADRAVAGCQPTGRSQETCPLTEGTTAEGKDEVNILQKLKARKRDMQAISGLIEASLARAAENGEPIAGAHQLALTAFEMPDGAATKALATFDKTSDDFREAVDRLEADALAELGLDVPPIESTSIPRTRLGKTDATFEAAIKGIYEFHNETDDYPPLSSAHVLAGVASVEHGVSARVFESMGIDTDELIDACRANF